MASQEEPLGSTIAEVRAQKHAPTDYGFTRPNYSPRVATSESLEPVPKPSVYARTLQKAAELLGSERALARYLNVPMPDVFVWMRPGALPPPEAIFLKAVDLVLNDLSDHDAERAQRLRVAAYHRNWTQNST